MHLRSAVTFDLPRVRSSVATLMRIVRPKRDASLRHRRHHLHQDQAPTLTPTWPACRGLHLQTSTTLTVTYRVVIAVAACSLGCAGSAPASTSHTIGPAGGTWDLIRLQQHGVRQGWLALKPGRGESPPPSPRLPRSLACVADAIVKGLSDLEIAEHLGMPYATVRTYIRRIYARLGVHSRVELARLWRT
jgi:hypothetical protein